MECLRVNPMEMIAMFCLLPMAVAILIDAARFHARKRTKGGRHA